jgi:hypothetical protein
MSLREKCIEVGREAMGRSSNWRWWAPRHLERLFDLWEPMIRSDERERQEIDFNGPAREDIRRALRAQIAADIEARCDKLSHRDRIATPPEWPVCAKCVPYFNIAQGESSGD